VHHVPRLTVLASIALGVGLVLAACGSAATPTGTPVAPSTAGPSGSPILPPPVEPTDSPVPSEPGQGNVDSNYPELAVELKDGYLVSVTDPRAKAWRIEVRGAGLKGADRIELVVEVGDVAPGAEVRFYVRGGLVDILTLDTLIGLETAAAGGCHPTLELCVSSGTIRIDPVAGRLTAAFETLSPAPVAIQGATADWPGEPFILGPWRTTEPFSNS
jgi:hypothetical protein